MGEAASRLQRTDRVAPTLRELDGVRKALAGVSDLAAAPDGAADRLAAALQRRREADRALEAAKTSLDDLERRMSARRPDPCWIKAEARVRELERCAVQVAGARESRPNRQLELAGSEAALAGLRRRLGLDGEAELEPLAPAPEVLEEVRRLASAAVDRAPRLQGARDSLATESQAVATLRARVADGQARGLEEPLGVDTATLATLPADAAAVRHRLQQARTDGEVLAAEAEELLPGGLGRLVALACPAAADVRAEIAVRDRGANSLGRLRESLSQARQQGDDAALDLARLRRGGEAATEGRVAEARTARDGLWAGVRETHLAGSPSPDAAQRRHEAEALDRAIADADVLSDRRTAEAQRIAALGEAEGRAAAAQVRTAALQEESVQEAEVLRDRAAAWDRAFPDPSLRAAEPAAMLAFVEARTVLLARADAQRRTDGEAREAEARLTPRLDQLARAELRLRLPGTGALEPRVAAVTRAAALEEAARVRHGQARRDLAGREEAEITARRRLQALESDQTGWETAWAAALPPLGLTGQVRPEVGADLASEWIGARGELRSLNQTQRRLRRMDEDEATLSGLAGALAAELKVEVAADPVAAADMLVARWREQDQLRLGHEALLPEQRLLRDASERAGDAARSAAADLSGVARSLGASPDDLQALDRLTERLGTRAALRSDETRLAAALRSAGEFLDEAVLREEAAGQDTDAVRGALTELAGRMEAADGELEEAVREEQRLRDVLRAHEATSSSQAVAGRESAVAQMHAAVERFVELKLARNLVAQAVQRVRAEMQDPLIRRAGALFARMTLEGFASVDADVDARGSPVVVGVRADGSRVAVSAMSDGTRDQLFLAFRLASLENYCSATEPLPFIADDILVHFDDARAMATLELLADFDAVTQVLLFTHHQSVRHAAMQMAEQGRASVVDIDRIPLTAPA